MCPRIRFPTSFAKAICGEGLGGRGTLTPGHRSQQSPHAFQINTAMFKESTGSCLAWKEGRLWAPL